jgi:hypothetical protein
MKRTYNENDPGPPASDAFGLKKYDLYGIFARNLKLSFASKTFEILEETPIPWRVSPSVHKALISHG